MKIEKKIECYYFELLIVLMVHYIKFLCYNTIELVILLSTRFISRVESLKRIIRKLRKNSKYNVVSIRLGTAVVFGNKAIVKIPSPRNINVGKSFSNGKSCKFIRI